MCALVMRRCVCVCASELCLCVSIVFHVHQYHVCMHVQHYHVYKCVHLSCCVSMCMNVSHVCPCASALGVMLSAHVHSRVMYCALTFYVMLYPCVSSCACVMCVTMHTHALCPNKSCFLCVPVKLQLQAEERGVVSIKGVSANRYLAMKDDGRLLALVSTGFFLCACDSPHSSKGPRLGSTSAGLASAGAELC